MGPPGTERLGPGSWPEFGDLLGTTRAAAWQRFARQAEIINKRTRRELLANRD